MDPLDCITWLPRLQRVPDPRQRRGQSFEWWYLLALITAALASGCCTITTITVWIHDHKMELVTSLHPAKKRIPSYATIRRVLVSIDVEALERQIAAYDQALDTDDATIGTLVGADGLQWRGQAVDGKTVRGASAHGSTVHLVSLVRHDSGTVLAQCQVADKSNEITAVPALLAGRDLTGTVTTMDALLTQQSQARQILAQGGHYLMVVKENQGTLYADLALLFEQPQALRGEQDPLKWCETSCGHGRQETRTLESSVALNGYVAWPGVGQVLRRTYDSIEPTTGKTAYEVTYGITSLSRRQALPEHVAWFWRQHWTIENRVHYVRDVTMGEDRCQVHTGKAPRVLAALRNGLLSLLRYRGWTNIAAALRFYGASPQKALRLIGALAT
jgi:predicted transposase YbfD/YdcC